MFGRARFHWQRAATFAAARVRAFALPGEEQAEDPGDLGECVFLHPGPPGGRDPARAEGPRLGGPRVG
eukprot:11155877-Lingulodinium_polyedra.AAC.1